MHRQEWHAFLAHLLAERVVGGAGVHDLLDDAVERLVARLLVDQDVDGAGPVAGLEQQVSGVVDDGLALDLAGRLAVRVGDQTLVPAGNDRP